MQGITEITEEPTEITPILPKPQQAPILSKATRQNLKTFLQNLVISPVSGTAAALLEYIISQDFQSSAQFAVSISSAFAIKSLNTFLFSFIKTNHQNATIALKLCETSLDILLPNLPMFGVRALMAPTLPLDENLELAGIFVALMTFAEVCRKLAEYATPAEEKKAANGTSAHLWANFTGSLIAGLAQGLAKGNVTGLLKKFAVSGSGFSFGILNQTLGPQLLEAAAGKLPKFATAFTGRGSSPVHPIIETDNTTSLINS